MDFLNIQRILTAYDSLFSYQLLLKITSHCTSPYLANVPLLRTSDYFYFLNNLRTDWGGVLI